MIIPTRNRRRSNICLSCFLWHKNNSSSSLLSLKRGNTISSSIIGSSISGTVGRQQQCCCHHRRWFIPILYLSFVFVVYFVLRLHSSLILPTMDYEAKSTVISPVTTTGIMILEGSSTAGISSSIQNQKQQEQEQEQQGPYSTFKNITFPLCLVHVGKAAGSSISCGLGLMYADCEGMPNDPIPNVNFFHMRRNKCRRQQQSTTTTTNITFSKDNNQYQNNKNITTTTTTTTTASTTFLVLIRNPISRIESWFEFEKNIIPKRKNKKEEELIKWKRGLLFVDCYKTFNDFVMYGLQPLSSTKKTNLVNNNNNNNMNYHTNINVSVSSSSSSSSSIIVNTSKIQDMTCQERAWAAILGVRAFSYHEWYNYEHYWNGIHSITKSPTIKVLRTEHLQEDWSSISKTELYRQVNKRPKEEDHDHSKNHHVAISSNKKENNDNNENDSNVETTNKSIFSPSTSNIDNNNSIINEAIITLTNKSRRRRIIMNSLLCNALCPEIQIYKQFLFQSQNLNQNQINNSIKELQMICPNESNQIQNNCPNIPIFPLQKISKGQYLQETKKRLFQIKKIQQDNSNNNNNSNNNKKKKNNKNNKK